MRSSTTPLRPAGRVAEVADAIDLLLGNVTGIVLDIDGGLRLT